MDNISLYLDYKPNTVFKTKVLSSFTPLQVCYYAIRGDEIFVSTSVTSLIKELGSFDVNERFSPDYSRRQYYDQWDTIDKRIFRLETFKQVTSNSKIDLFEQKRTKIGKELYLSLTERFLKEFIFKIEIKFPEHQFVVYTGGRDSRIIHCIPKQRHQHWHVFSSEPNGTLAKEWLRVNKITYGKFFTHSGNNDDTQQDLINKIVASDYMVRPADLRWTRTACEIARYFDNKCVFILGNAGDTLYANRDKPMQANNYKDFFTLQRIMTAGIQGTYHQTISNLTGCPVVSLYSYDKLWFELYQLFDPAEFHGQDLRAELGNRLIGRSLQWFGDDPLLRPGAWEHDKTQEELLKIYKDAVWAILNKS